MKHNSVHSPQWIEQVRPLMGCFVAIAAYCDTVDQAVEGINACFEYLKDCVLRLSDWEEASETTRLNRQRYLEKEACSAELWELVELSLKITQETGGFFNPLCLKMSKLWREAKAKGAIPEAHELATLLEQISDPQVFVDATRGIALLKQNQEFDFSSIGKGYLAQKACDFLKARGVKFARVDCGGDMHFLGNTIWEIEVEDPRGERSIGSFKLQGDWAVASSGDYRNCWRFEGRWYHHLICPKTGLPGRHCQQVTMVHRNGAYADALATAIFFLPPEKGIDLIRKFPDAGAIIVDKSREIFVSENLNFIRQW